MPNRNNLREERFILVHTSGDTRYYGWFWSTTWWGLESPWIQTPGHVWKGVPRLCSFCWKDPHEWYHSMEQSPRPNKKKGTVSTSIHGSAPLLWKPHDQLPHTSVSRRPCCDRLYSQTEGENKPFLPRISFVWDFVCGHETSNKDHRNGGSLVAGVRGVLFCCLCGWEAENLN